MLRIPLSSPRSVRVHGTGRIVAGGTLVLEQLVEEEGKPATRRTWHMRETSPGHITGTLTDAVGPIEGTVSGNRFRLRFKIKGGLQAEQWISVKSGGASAHNVMKIRKFGFVVASLDETIKQVR